MAALDQAAGLLQDHVRHFDMALGRFVKGRSDDLCLDAAAHVRDFFRTLVDQQDNFINLWMVVRNSIGY